MAASRELLQKRKSVLLSDLTELCDFFNNLKQKEAHQIEAKYQKLLSLESKTDELFDGILEYNINAKGKLEEIPVKDRNQFLDLIDSIRGAYIKWTSNRKEPAKSLPDINVLPKLTLPIFGGEIDTWANFLSLFNSLVHTNNSLSKPQKFHYLKANLRGEALSTISTFEISDENYELAYNALYKRYQNTRRIGSFYINNILRYKNQYFNPQQFLNLHEAAVSALQHLNFEDLGDFVLFQLIYNNLDPSLQRDFDMTQKVDKVPSSEELFEYIRLVAKSDELKKSNKPVSKVSKYSVLSFKRKENFGKSDSIKCVHCGLDHYLAYCANFKNLSDSKKLNFVKSKNLCLNCLGSHHVKNCFSKKVCRECGEKHHSWLHRGLQSAGSNASTSPVKATEIRPTTVHLSRSSKCVLLATATILVRAMDGTFLSVRALIDQASEVSFVSQSLIKKLQLNVTRNSVFIRGIGDIKCTNSKGVASIKFSSRIDQSKTYEISAYILSTLTSYLPSKTSLSLALHELEDLALADKNIFAPEPIDIILGSDIYPFIIQEGLRKFMNDSLVAQKTSLGWIISGVLEGVEERTKTTLRCSIDQEFTELVQRFFGQESFPPEQKVLSNEEQECEDLYNSTFSRDSTGRYVVKLPFKKDPELLGESKSIASNYYHHLKTRLAKNPTLSQAYEEFMDEYLKLGHMKRTITDQVRGYFMPHHGVHKETSTTTKLRVVFNASQKTSSGYSLNDLLHVGPCLLPNSIDILTRWRRYKVVLSSDIEKMYRQIQIHEDDKKYQRILWGSPLVQVPESFELQTVTYGTACAPFLAIRTIHQLASDEEGKYSMGSDALRNDTYMDDILTGEDDESKAKEKRDQIIQILSSAGFRARKWTSNCQSLIEDLPIDLKATSLSLSFKFEIFSMLGLNWESNQDRFVFRLNLSPLPEDINKRVVLSRIAQLFDPLGFLTPITIVLKIFFQTLWLLKLDWDECLPQKYSYQWRHLYNQLDLIRELSIPRWLGCSSEVSYELHAFGDASEAAYASVIYLKCYSKAKEAKISLIISKSRVAPLKPVSVPRLELNAALLSAKLMAHTQTTLNLSNLTSYLWSDSSIVLYWIKSHPAKFKTFVANRVTQIQSLTSSSKWLYIPSKENPADCATRGIAAESLVNHPLWWSGPRWLGESPDRWPNQSVLKTAKDEREERSTKNFHSLTAKADLNNNDLLLRFSSLNRLLRVTAWCLRFKNNARKAFVVIEPKLSVQEVEQSHLVWIKIIQAHYFFQEISNLSTKSSLTKSSAILGLSPFLDSEGILRVGGRLAHSNLTFSQKHPIILPFNCHFSKLIVQASHLKTLHGGVTLTLSDVRQTYWVLKGRRLVKDLVGKCLKCLRYRALPLRQKMADLPPTRTKPSRAFLHVGIDYAGPFIVTPLRGRGIKSQKAFVALFVCLSTKAVHIELVSDYSSAAFLAAFRRFTSRRGLCATIVSDNGTNFVGAKKELTALFNQATREGSLIAQEMSKAKINWTFNPPNAPHFGGLWEAAIKSAKSHLKRTIGDTILSFEEMTTLLSQIEAVLNSRPLVPLYDDIESLDVLTPGHFLIGEPLLAVPEGSIETPKLSLLTRWQLIQQLRNSFWKRWSADYLNYLQTRQKWQNPSPNLRPGSLVLIMSENSPPSKWPLGRILSVFPGPDGLVRVATIKTATSTFTRPIVKLILLANEDAISN